MQCVHDPAAPVDVPTGLCLPINQTHTTDDWVARCGQLLRSQRKYRIGRAVQQSGGDVLELAEIYEPEFPQETNSCTTDADCRGVSVLSASGTVTATACRADSDAAHTMRCLLPCKSEKDTICGVGFVCATSQATDKPGEFRCMRAPIDHDLWKLCYREVQDYEVHVGDAFLVYGNASGYVAYQEQNASNECFVPPVLGDEFERLRQARVPLSPNVACPPSMTSPLDSMDPSLHTNVCQFNGVSGFQVVHFENPVMNIALQIPKQGINNRVVVPPDQTQILWTVVGGGNPLTAPLGVEIQAQQPRYAVVAPDRQTVYVIDEGKSPSATGLRGQLLRLYSTTQQVDSLFRVR
jgi:hypothetical protein